ncbi:hypothetical protein [Oligoflexus tunisiensis]|uniref:hypothetical protein n=1 Tax=Oligoflexus tunisiensis TaxID=708132 RepID=UPI00114D19C6|nr:hypothetical protein [Oligoflexus tunisiensis]
MKKMMILVAGAMLSLSAGAYAGGPGKHGKMTEWTKEQRETMAKNHEMMATCLRSDRSVGECHEEMMKSCKDNDACPMKGRMGMHHGMHEGKGTKPQNSQ